MASDVEHVVEVVTDEHDHRYRAECSCGWVSEWFAYDDEAEWAAEDHREVVVERPDRFSSLMDDLLDFQDAIGQVVVWLAENWSPALPIPRWYSGGVEGVDLRVLIYCPEPSQLDHAAELLNAALVDDDRPGSSGHRYRRATRRFGCVEVAAYTSLATTCTECGTEFTGAHCPGCYDPPEATRSLVLAGELAPAVEVS